MFNNLFSKNKCILVSNFLDFRLKNKIIYDKKIDYSFESYSFEILDKFSILNLKEEYKFSRYENICRDIDKLLFETSDLKCDLFILKSGFIGRELSKSPSFNYIASNKTNQVLLEVINGSGFILLEEIENSNNIKFIKVKIGSKVIIDRGFAAVLINNSSQNLVLTSLYSSNLEFNYNLFKNNFGTTIFLIQSGFIKNQNVAPMYHLEEFENNYLLDYKFKEDITNYEELLELPEKFYFLKN